MPPQHPTLPSLLRNAGYATTLIGKWHLGVLPAFGPLQSGYEHFWGFRTAAVDYYSHRNARGEDDLWDGDLAIQQTGYLTDLLGDRAVDTIDRHAREERPFLLSLHFSAPHSRFHSRVRNASMAARPCRNSARFRHWLSSV